MTRAKHALSKVEGGAKEKFRSTKSEIRNKFK